MSVITTSDIKYYLSGGATNTDPNASLGGAISTTELVDDTLHNLFAKVGAAEALAGSTKYRALYVKNENASSLTFQDIVAYISSQTTSGDTSIEISVATEDADATIQTIVNENTAPTGQTYISAVGVAEGQDLGDLDAGSYRGVWIKRVVTAGATAYGSDTATIGVRGETTAS
jgi:hypothetical protein